MSEAVGPQTKAEIQQMKRSNTTGEGWGRKAMLWFFVGGGLILAGLFIIYASYGFSIRGWDGLVPVLFLIVAVPIALLVGLVLSILAMIKDANRMMAALSMGLWLLLSVGWLLIFVMR